MGAGDGDWGGFSSNRRRLFALLSAAVWEELQERLIPSCALVKASQYFFRQLGTRVF